MKLFIVLGNQLFSPRYLNEFKDHIIFMAEDYGLCTFEKHHKFKILLFLSSMRSYRDDLKSKNLCISKSYSLLVEKKVSLVSSKFYQKLFVFLISFSTILIFPESPKELENICASYNSRKICNVW